MDRRQEPLLDDFQATRMLFNILHRVKPIYDLLNLDPVKEKDNLLNHDPVKEKDNTKTNRRPSNKCNAQLTSGSPVECESKH